MRWYGLGLGGAGGNIMDATYGLMRDRFVEALVLNTARADASRLVHLRKNFIAFGKYGEHGVGARWKDAYRSLQEEDLRDSLIDKLRGTGLLDATAVLMTAGLGGGTGSGSAPVVADYVREVQGGPDRSTVPLIVVGVLPFDPPRETIRFAFNSAFALANLLDRVDSIFLVDNQHLYDRLRSENPGLGDSAIVGMINSMVGRFLRVISAAGASAAEGGFKTVFDSQDLRSILMFPEASLAVPCYASARAEAVGEGLRFLVARALREGAFAPYERGTAIRVGFVARGPSHALTVKATHAAKEYLMREAASLDIREGIVVDDSSPYVEVSVLLVEPTIPRIRRIIEWAREYYAVHRDELLLNEDIGEEEFNRAIAKLQAHLILRDQERRVALSARGGAG